MIVKFGILGRLRPRTAVSQGAFLSIRPNRSLVRAGTAGLAVLTAAAGTLSAAAPANARPSVSGVSAYRAGGGSTTALFRAAAARRPVSLSVSGNKVIVPSRLRPGFTDFVNTSKQIIVIARKGKRGANTLAHELSADRAGHRRWLADYPTHVVSYGYDRVVSFRLIRGDYFFVDASQKSVNVTEVRTVHVAGARRDAARPHAVAVTVDSHNRLGGPTTMQAGIVDHVRNLNAHHELLAVFRAGRNATDQQLAAFVAHPTWRGLGSLDVTSYGTLAAVGGGGDVYTGGIGQKGRYLLLALAFTARTGNPVLSRGRAERLDIV